MGDTKQKLSQVMDRDLGVKIGRETHRALLFFGAKCTTIYTYSLTVPRTTGPLLSHSHFRSEHHMQPHTSRATDDSWSTLMHQNTHCLISHKLLTHSLIHAMRHSLINKS